MCIRDRENEIPSIAAPDLLWRGERRNSQSPGLRDFAVDEMPIGFDGGHRAEKLQVLRSPPSRFHEGLGRLQIADVVVQLRKPRGCAPARSGLSLSLIHISEPTR